MVREMIRDFKENKLMILDWDPLYPRFIGWLKDVISLFSI